MILQDKVQHVSEIKGEDIDDFFKLTLEELEQIEMIRDPKLRIQLCPRIREKGYVIFHVTKDKVVLTHIKDLQYAHVRSARENIIADNSNERRA